MNNDIKSDPNNGRANVPSGFSGEKAVTLRRRWEIVLKLPEPGKEWKIKDLREKDQYANAPSSVDNFVRRDIVTQVGREYDPDQNKHINIYETDADAYERALEYQTTMDTLPCCSGGTGIKNVGSDDESDEPPYECRACGARHDRETVLKSGVLS